MPGATEVLLAEQARLTGLIERLHAAEIATATEALLTLGRAVLLGYAQRKRDMAALDYDDLIVLTRDLLRRPGLAPWVLFKLDGGIDHILIDEAQDTSPEQWDIVAAIADEFLPNWETPHKRPPLFTLGDSNQSI